MKLFNYKFLFLLFAILSLTACDPLQTIVIENKTNSEASILFVFNEGNPDYNFSETRDADTLLLELDNTPENATRQFDFGMGTWEIENSMNQLVETVDLIEINTPTTTETYQDKEQIRTFFESRISKKQKAVILIEIE